MHWMRYAVGWGILSALCAPMVAGAQSGMLPRLVLTEKEAFGALPAEIVAAPMVQRMSLSSSGRYLLVLREQVRLPSQISLATGAPPPIPTGEKSLVLWNSRTRAVKTVWHGDFQAASVEQMEWLPQSETAVALVRLTVPNNPANPQAGMTSRMMLLRITDALEKAQEIRLPDGDDTTYLTLHPAPAPSGVFPVGGLLESSRFVLRDAPQPDGTVKKIPENQVILSTLLRDGRLGVSVTLPAELGYNGVEWAEDGSPVLRGLVRVGEKGVKTQFHALDTRIGQLKLLEKRPKFFTPTPPDDGQTLPLLSLRLKTTHLTAQEEETRENVGLLWLESLVKSEQPRALISSDNTGGQLLPHGEGLLYQSQGALWFVPLLRMDKAAYQAARLAAEKTRLISNAKQLGLGLLMYAQDYDETLPNGDGITDKIRPYLKNDSLFDGFVYTYNGGALADIEKPAETVLGFVSGPGGRANIYADGHVKWANN